MLQTQTHKLGTVIVLRGCSGGGKSTFAKFIKDLAPWAIICSADEFMFEDGEYKFEVRKLGFCHIKCMHQFKTALEDGAELVIVDNTNTKVKDYSFYEDLAKEKGYRVFVLVVENTANQKDIHGVPEATLTKQAENIKTSLRLLPKDGP